MITWRLGELLAARLRETPRREVVSERIERCNYAWDNTASRETPECEAKEHVYALARDMLNLGLVLV
jgi:hypothetical protein